MYAFRESGSILKGAPSYMKKLLTFCLALCMLFSAVPSLAQEDDPLSKFAVRNGSRGEKRIAITVDDSFDLDYTWKIRDLLHDLGVVGTFFPIGKQIHPEDGPEWQKILDYGSEIGSHNMGHYKMGNSDAWSIISALGRYQQTLDEALGYHYQVHCFRPPYGNITNDQGKTDTFRRAVLKFGYEHVILWDVSQTDPDKAYRQVQNGSILLYHARHKDYVCLQTLIPRLLEDGYELVTVSQLLGFGENEISPEPYVYNKADYEKKN